METKDEKETIQEVDKQDSKSQKPISATDILYFEKWLSSLGEKKATDMHLTVGNVPMLRIGDKISPLMNEDIITAERLQSIVEHLLSKNELDNLLKNKQIIISITLKKVMRFRIHISYSRGFLVLSLRHLSSEIRTFEELGLPQMIKDFTTVDQGLCIIGGPFDSGRTTTIRAILSEINKTQEKYIITLEEPIEYIIPSDKSIVVQREIGKDVKDFETALAAIKDEDVNIVAVSSIKSPAALEHIIDIANTGRLVFAAIDGRYSVSILEELKNLFPKEKQTQMLNLISDTLLGINIQLLLPRVGGGRILITESLRATHPIKALIKEDKFSQIPNIMQTSAQEGMVNMDKALATAVKSGKIKLEDAKDHAIDIAQFNLLVSH